MSATHLDGGRSYQPVVSASPIPRRIVVFEGGVPVVKDSPLVTPAVIKEIGAAALAELYAEPGDALAVELGLPPSEFYGRPLVEVMLIRQARNAARTGDMAEVEAILDRQLGKPKTTAENHNITESYEDALNRIGAAEDARRVQEARPIDAEVVPAAREPWEDLI